MGGRQKTVAVQNIDAVPSKTAVLRPLERRGLIVYSWEGGRQKIAAVQNKVTEPSETAVLRPLECDGKVF